MNPFPPVERGTSTPLQRAENHCRSVCERVVMLWRWMPPAERARLGSQFPDLSATLRDLDAADATVTRLRRH